MAAALARTSPSPARDITALQEPAAACDPVTACLRAVELTPIARMVVRPDRSELGRLVFSERPFAVASVRPRASHLVRQAARAEAWLELAIKPEDGSGTPIQPRNRGFVVLRTHRRNSGAEPRWIAAGVGMCLERGWKRPLAGRPQPQGRRRLALAPAKRYTRRPARDIQRHDSPGPNGPQTA